MAKMKKTSLTDVGEAMQQLQLWSTAGGSTKGHRGKQFCHVSGGYTRLPDDTSIPVPRIYPREMETYAHTKSCL